MSDDKIIYVVKGSRRRDAPRTETEQAEQLAALQAELQAVAVRQRELWLYIILAALVCVWLVSQTLAWPAPPDAPRYGNQPAIMVHQVTTTPRPTPTPTVQTWPTIEATMIPYPETVP